MNTYFLLSLSVLLCFSAVAVKGSELSDCSSGINTAEKTEEPSNKDKLYAAVESGDIKAVEKLLEEEEINIYAQHDSSKLTALNKAPKKSR